METEDRYAIRVGIVVRDRQRFEFVGLVSNVVSGNPLSRAAKGLPVAEVKAGLQGTGSTACRAP
jgi:hypothetical protein